MNSVGILHTDMYETDEFEWEDEFQDLMADLLSLRECEPLLTIILTGAAGEWIEVLPLCTKLVKISNRLQQLQAHAGETLFVTWLEYPSSIDSEGFCLVSFLVPGLMLIETAVYNRARLLACQNGTHS
ncbi:MAG: hypothetical protein R3A44_09565 [Caldilineaceae bacterium]